MSFRYGVMTGKSKPGALSETVVSVCSWGPDPWIRNVKKQDLEGFQRYVEML